MLRHAAVRRVSRSPFVRSSLHHSEWSTPDRSTAASASRKELKTPLCEDFLNRIVIHGYLPISSFMRDALMQPQYGYYSRKKTVIGGEDSDFITAAEIPLFGDVLSGWVVDCWQKMGTPRVCHLVELGPGRGTLVGRMLKQIKHAQPQLLNFLQVHLVEAGEMRREEQRKALAEYQTAQQRIRWWNSVEALPFILEPMIFIANEYFDALPVGQYTFTERGWVETALEVDEDPSHESHFRRVHAPGGTFSSFMVPDEVRKNGKHGDTIEINAVGMQTMELIMKKMVDCGKAACLIIDYGKDEHMHNTLRGIRRHQFVDPLLSPGEIDLSAWVSFRQLRYALERLEVARRHLKWHPVITQAEFLELNGVDVRLAHMIKGAEGRQAMRMLHCFRRLVEPDQMGASYKVFAVQSESLPNVAPFF